MAIDQHHDPGFGRLRVLLEQHPGVYDTVKTASFEDERALPSHAFAWPERRLFPVHNAKHAALSYLYAKDDAGVPGPVREKIAESLDVFGVSRELFAPVAVKTAAAPEDCVFPESGTYPARTPAEVKFAEQRLHEQLPRMSTETRARAFTRLYEKAAALDVELQPRSLRYAGLVESDPRGVDEQLRARAGATKVASLRDRYATLAASVRRDPQALRRRETQLKLASAIHALDREAGVESHYDRQLADPVAAVFNTTKVAGERVDLGGVEVSAARLRGQGVEFYRDVLGPDYAHEVAPDGKTVDQGLLVPILKSLPSDLKMHIARQLGA